VPAMRLLKGACDEPENNRVLGGHLRREHNGGTVGNMQAPTTIKGSALKGRGMATEVLLLRLLVVFAAAPMTLSPQLRCCASDASYSPHGSPRVATAGSPRNRTSRVLPLYARGSRPGTLFLVHHASHLLF
jgi:hypothetical protein